MQTYKSCSFTKMTNKSQKLFIKIQYYSAIKIIQIICLYISSQTFLTLMMKSMLYQCLYGILNGRKIKVDLPLISNTVPCPFLPMSLGCWHLVCGVLSFDIPVHCKLLFCWPGLLTLLIFWLSLRIRKSISKRSWEKMQVILLKCFISNWEMMARVKINVISQNDSLHILWEMDWNGKYIIILYNRLVNC